MIISRYFSRSLLALWILCSTSCVCAGEPVRAVLAIEVEPQVTELVKDLQNACAHATSLSLAYRFELIHPQRQDRAQLPTLKGKTANAHQVLVEAVKRLNTCIIHLNRGLEYSTTKFESIYHLIEDLLSLAELGHAPSLYVYIYLLTFDIISYTQTRAHTCPTKDSVLHATILGNVNFISRYNPQLGNALRTYLHLYEQYKQEQIELFYQKTSLTNSCTHIFIKSWNYIRYALKNHLSFSSSIERFIHQAPRETLLRMQQELREIFNQDRLLEGKDVYQNLVADTCKQLIDDIDQIIETKKKEPAPESINDQTKNIALRWIYAAYTKISHVLKAPFCIEDLLNHRRIIEENTKVIIELFH